MSCELSLSGPIDSPKLSGLVVARPRQRRRSSPESVVLSSIELELTGGQPSLRMECEILSACWGHQVSLILPVPR